MRALEKNPRWTIDALLYIFSRNEDPLERPPEQSSLLRASRPSYADLFGNLGNIYWEGKMFRRAMPINPFLHGQLSRVVPV